MFTLTCIAITWQLEYYTNIPCDCGPYTRRFSRGTMYLELYGCVILPDANCCIIF